MFLRLLLFEGASIAVNDVLLHSVAVHRLVFNSLKFMLKVGLCNKNVLTTRASLFFKHVITHNTCRWFVPYPWAYIINVMLPPARLRGPFYWLRMLVSATSVQILTDYLYNTSVLHTVILLTLCFSTVLTCSLLGYCQCWPE